MVLSLIHLVFVVGFIAWSSSRHVIHDLYCVWVAILVQVGVDGGCWFACGGVAGLLAFVAAAAWRWVVGFFCVAWVGVWLPLGFWLVGSVWVGPFVLLRLGVV